jgi:pilus assembly protein CpaF
VRAIREQIANSVHIIVQQSRLSDGSRKVTGISEVIGIDDTPRSSFGPSSSSCARAPGPGRQGLGEFRATGYLPSFLDVFIVMGLVKPGEPFV